MLYNNICQVLDSTEREYFPVAESSPDSADLEYPKSLYILSATNAVNRAAVSNQNSLNENHIQSFNGVRTYPSLTPNSSQNCCSIREAYLVTNTQGLPSDKGKEYCP